jgi:hypothetical protein
MHWPSGRSMYWDRRIYWHSRKEKVSSTTWKQGNDNLLPEWLTLFELYDTKMLMIRSLRITCVVANCVRLYDALQLVRLELWSLDIPLLVKCTLSNQYSNYFHHRHWSKAVLCIYVHRCRRSRIYSNADHAVLRAVYIWSIRFARNIKTT